MDDINILMLAPFYNVYIKEFTETLADYVSSITVVVHHNPLTEISKYLPKRGYIRYLYRYTKGNLIDKEEIPDNVTIEIVSLPYFIPDGKNPFLGDRVFRKVDKMIQQKSIKFDILHAHSTWISGYVGVKLGMLYNVPSIITVHENAQMLFKERQFVNQNLIWTLQNSNLLISVNQKEIEILQKFNKNIIYIPNGFNSKKICEMNQETARKILGLPPTKKIIFSLGYLIREKGFQYLVLAIKDIVDKRDDVLCFIGGEGSMRDELQTLINKLGLNNYVKLLGYVSSKKNEWLNASDIFVFPSLRESFGIPVLEALAVGTPVVSTINGGSEEIITSEEYGLLAKPADPEDLAKKILIALERDWNREKIRKYAEQFTWDNIAKQMLKIYKNVLHNEDVRIGV